MGRDPTPDTPGFTTRMIKRGRQQVDAGPDVTTDLSRRAATHHDICSRTGLGDPYDLGFLTDQAGGQRVEELDNIIKKNLESIES